MQALADFDREETIFRRLTAAHPGRSELRRNLASALNSRAKVLGDLRRFDPAEKAQREALGLAEKLVASEPSNTEDRELLAMMASNLGVLLKDTDRAKEAVPVLNRAIALRQELVKEQPTSARLRMQLAQSWVSLGAALHTLREFGPAQGAFEETLKVLDHETLKPKREERELARSVELRAMAFSNLGNVLYQTRRYADAEKNYREAIGYKQSLVRKFPSVPRYRYEMAGSFTNLGNALSDLNRRYDARIAYERAVAISEELVRGNRSQG